MRKFVAFCDKLNEWIGSYIVTAAVFILIGVIFTNVVLRYVFNTSFVFMAEVEWHIFAFIFLMGGGYTLLHEGHVRVDIFFSLVGNKKRALINLLGVLVFLLPSCYLVLTTSIPWVVTAFKVGEVSLDPGGIPARFLLKAVLPMGYFLMLLQGLSLGIKSVFILLDKPLEKVL